MPDRPPSGGPDGDLLARYLAGECSEAEAAAVRRYLMARPNAARALEQYLLHLDGAASRPESPDSGASWAALRARLAGVDQEASPGRVSTARGADPPGGTPGSSGARRRPFGALGVPGRSARWQRVAAAAIAASVAAVAALGYEPARRTGVAAPSPPRTYATAFRQRAELTLSDGTRVRVAPASRLRVAADFGAERRDVYLEGEAYFEVVHDETRPFTVFARNASASDLGTAFSVRSYPEDQAVRVVVRDGAVALSGVGRLDAGDVGRLHAEGRGSVQRGADVDALLGWLDGGLTFDDVPLGGVLQDMRRWYGVDVRLADSSLASLPFTGVLTGLPPRAAVDLVGATLGLRVVRDGDQVSLERIAGRTPHPSSHRAPRGARSSPRSAVPP